MHTAARRPLAGLALVLLAGVAGSLRARDLDLNVSSPAIEKLKASLAARANTTGVWKAKGSVGEGKDGLLAVRSLEGMDLRQKKEVQDAVALENGDRRALYRELLKAQGLEAEPAERVMAAAARQRRAEAKPDEWVQRPEDGAWVQKKNM